MKNTCAPVPATNPYEPQKGPERLFLVLSGPSFWILKYLLAVEKAIRFYAARMNNDKYRLTSFEQVANINRLLMEQYKDD